VPQHQSPLLRLPGELRNRIYEYTYSGPDDLCIVNTNRYDYNHTDAQAKVYGLLQLNSVGDACRQLCSRTAGMRRRIKRANSCDTPLHQITSYNVAKIVWFDRSISLHARDINNSIQYCIRYPQTEIFFLTERLSLKGGILALLTQGAAYQMYLRGQAIPFHLDEAFYKDVLEITQAMRKSSFNLDRKGA
jgi:hypothetical protein